MPGQAASIERDDAIVRTRRTAACVRVALGCLGIALIAIRPGLLPAPALGVAGFAIVLLTSLTQLAQIEVRWARVEEAFAASAAILVIGCGDQRVTILSLLWLVALAAGVMARGRVGVVGRAVVLVALVLPIVRQLGLELECLVELGVPLAQGFHLGVPGRPWPALSDEGAASLGRAGAARAAEREPVFVGS